MLDASLISATELASLEAAGLGALGTRLMQQLDHARREIDWRDAKLQKLTFEMAQLKRVKFGKKSGVYDFTISRSGEHARALTFDMRGSWRP